MNCFRHPAVSAVGMCKACHKGLCPECAGETPFGLACRDSCETEVNELGDMNERGKKIYGIGRYRSRIPASGVLLWGTVTAILWIVTLLVYFDTEELKPELVVPGILLTLIFAFTWYSSRRTGLKC